MSAPEPNTAQQGIGEQIYNTAKNAVNYVVETVQGNTAEASKEANKEQAKGNVPGSDSASDRISGALGAAGDKLDQHKHEASAKANKESI